MSAWANAGLSSSCPAGLYALLGSIRLPMQACANHLQGSLDSPADGVRIGRALCTEGGGGHIDCHLVDVSGEGNRSESEGTETECPHWEKGL